MGKAFFMLKTLQFKYQIVFYLLLGYMLINIPLYLQSFLLPVTIIRFQIIDLAAWTLIFAVLFYLLFAKKIVIQIDAGILKWYLIWIGFSMVSVVALLRFNYQIVYDLYLFYFLMTYFVLLFVLAIGFEPNAFKSLDKLIKQIPQILSIIYLPVLLLAIVQFVFHDNFLSMNTDDKTMQASSELLGTFRPRSVFNSSYELGLLATLVFALHFPYIWGKLLQIKSYHWLMCFIGLAGILLSQTRNVYFIALMFVVNFILVKQFFKYKFWLKAMPILFVLLLSSVLVFMAFQALSGDLLSDFFSNESTFVRFTFLYTLMEGLVLKGSPLDLLFGWGLMQHAGDSNIISIFPNIYNSEDGALGIDNLFFGMFLNQGLIGLGIFLTLFYKVWNKLCSLSYETMHPFYYSVMALFGGYLGAGVFNLIHVSVYSNLLWFFAFLVLAHHYAKYENKSN